MKRVSKMKLATHCSQSIEDWAIELVSAYKKGKARPDSIALIIDRYGECYEGFLYVVHQDEEDGNEDDIQQERQDRRPPDSS